MELLKKVGMSESKPTLSPMTTSIPLVNNDITIYSNHVRYCQVVEALQYVSLYRPNIIFVINKVYRFMHAPIDNHWSTFKRILRYLHITGAYGMLICQTSNTQLHAFTDSHWKGTDNLTAFSDANWVGDPDDRRSTGGFELS